MRTYFGYSKLINHKAQSYSFAWEGVRVFLEKAFSDNFSRDEILALTSSFESAIDTMTYIVFEIFDSKQAIIL